MHVFAVLEREIHYVEYCQSSKLSRLKIVARYIRRPEQLSFAGCGGGAIGCSFNRQVFQSLIEVALYTPQRSNNDWNNCYPLMPLYPGELYGQVFIMVNLLPVLALNIGVPRHSYNHNFYLAIHSLL